MSRQNHDHERDFQNGFGKYKNRLSAIRAFKGTVLTDDRRNHLTDYCDLGEVVDDEERSAVVIKRPYHWWFLVVDVLEKRLENEEEPGIRIVSYLIESIEKEMESGDPERTIMVDRENLRDVVDLFREYLNEVENDQ